MNIQAPAITTADDFLRWNEGREGKREFVRKRIVEMMTGGSRNHAELSLQLAMLLKAGLDPRTIVVTVADYAVRTPFGVRYPDVMVELRDDAAGGLATEKPLFIAEVLSPTSLARDFGEKVTDYTGLESLAHYLILSQDEPRVWLFSRGEDGGFAREPEMLAGSDATLELAGLGVTLALADLYRGIA